MGLPSPEGAGNGEVGPALSQREGDGEAITFPSAEGLKRLWHALARVGSKLDLRMIPREMSSRSHLPPSPGMRGTLEVAGGEAKALVVKHNIWLWFCQAGKKVPR